MKKLVIAFFAVAVAAAANAATFTWTISNVYAGNNTDKASGAGYIFTTASVASADLATALIEAYGKDELSTYLSEKAAYKFDPSAAGTYSVTTANKVQQSAMKNIAGGETYTFYALIFDTNTISDTSKFYITNELSKTVPNSTSNVAIALGNQSERSQVASNWTAVGVPEPTSGLLLLLGMAGLALKRKQA